MKLSRRQLVGGGAALGAAGVAAGALVGRNRGGAPLLSTSGLSASTAPNVLFILVDQMAATAIGAHGSARVETPNMDRLVAAGTSFTESYCVDPSCCPARAGWLTGRMSSENGVLVNPLPLRDDIPDLGTWVSEHSAHESVYIGKWHVPGRDVRQSFDMLHPSSIGGEASDLSQVRTLEGFLQSRSPDAPFFATLSLLNPHDICMFLQAEWNATPADMLGLDPAELPPLPPNFHAPNDEPALFREVKRGTLPQATWPREKWQIYRWWYDRMVENVDGAIGRVLDLVWNSRWGEDTVIILSADHGDMQGEHKIVNKQTFYDASAKVPMIVAAPGRFPARGRDRRHLVSGVDVPSTVCELIGIDPPPLQRGRSLVPLLEGRATSWRDHLQVQTLVEGRVIRSQDYKYVTFRGDPKELLFDLRNDPWEIDDLAEDSTYASVLEDHRRMQVEFEAQLENTALSDEGWHAARAARGI